MNVMKEVLLTTLRNKNTGRADFREATKKLGYVLAVQAAEYIQAKKVSFYTPLARTQGLAFAQPIMFVPILRSGMALLPPFLQFFPEAYVGVIGIRRDEKTAKPKLYYKNWPRVVRDTQIIILDPMLATGGTLIATLSLLTKIKGFKEENILFVGIVASPE
ncbi:MAG: uracil phosphoribosyltransferase, partial [bacterium]